MSSQNTSKMLDTNKLHVKKKKTMKKSTKSASKYLEFLKNRDNLSKDKIPIDVISQNVDLNNNIMPQNIPDLDKPLNQSTINRAKLLENPKIDIKMPQSLTQSLTQSLQKSTKSNIKVVKVDDNVKQPKFTFNRSKKKIKVKTKKPKKKSEMKKSKKKTKKARKISFTVKKPKQSECEKFKQISGEIDTKNKDDMIKELKGKGISVSGKSNKLLKDVYMCVMDNNINIKRS